MPLSTDARKDIKAIAERMQSFAIVQREAGAELLKKWAREIEKALKRED